MKLISIPFSGGGLGHGNGANLAPAIIIKQLEELFANEDGKPVSFEQDIIKVNEQNIQESHNAIYEVISKLKEKVILIGGDHSITHPAVKGFKQSFNKLHSSDSYQDFHFIVFDAHPDMMDDFRPPTQEDYLRVLIEEGVIKAEDVFLIGVRNWDKEEVNYLKEKGVKCFSAKEIFEKGIKTVMLELLGLLTKPIYLSLDIDVVDPVEAIGTGYIEHGGLSSRELIYALQELKATKELACVDIVEVNPKKDIKDMTSKLAAKCIIELADY